MSTLARVRRLLPLLVAVALLAACGSSPKPTTTTTAAKRPVPPGTVLYEGAAWAVAVSGPKATAYHLVGGAWRPDRTGQVKIDILGPKPSSKGNAATPQVAFEMTGKSALIDSALWVDGAELLTKGGGLGPDQGTVYGAPNAPLKKGLHVAVAYGRTATHATAVAWVFRV
jgi:hypothetical protein